MRGYQIFMVSILLFSGGACADSQEAKDVQKAQTCAECHGADGFDLSGTKSDELVTSINAIRAGDAKHPTKLDGLTDADVAEIAKILARGY